MCINLPITSFAKTAQSHFISTQNKSEDTSKKLHNDAQEMPNNEDESKDENETFILKLLISPTKALVIYDQIAAKFLLYNATHTIQFHPEFSTPPPKQTTI